MLALFVGSSAGFISAGFSTEQGGGKTRRPFWPLVGSCAMFMRDVTTTVHRSQLSCLPIDYANAGNIWAIRSNGDRSDLFEGGNRGRWLDGRSNGGQEDAEPISRPYWISCSLGSATRDWKSAKRLAKCSR